MATDINQIVTVGYLQSYDKKIKQAYKTADTTLETKLMDVIGKINSFEITIVDELPQTGVIGTFYLIKADPGEYNGDNNVYKEYLWYMKKEADDTAGTPAEYGWELVGDTKLDLDELKADLNEACVQSVEVTSEEQDAAETAGFKVTTYTVSYKNGKGEVIDTETLNAIVDIKTATAWAPSDPSNGVNEVLGNDGLMTAHDKYVLYKLNAEQGDYITKDEANSKFVATAELGEYADATAGAETTHTATVTLSAADDTELDTFDVKYVTYAEAVSAGETTAAVGGLMSSADKDKLDGLNLSDPADIDDWFDTNWPNP